MTYPNETYSPLQPALRRRLLGITIAAVLSLASFSCSKENSGGDETGKSCTTDSDCSTGRQCDVKQGVCVNATGLAPDGSGGTTSGGITVGTLKPGDGGITEVDPLFITGIQDNACSGWTTELETLPAALEFVVDTSYSMAEGLESGTTWSLQGSGPTKWQITHDALVPALDDLSPTLSVGMVFFPNHAIVNRTYTTPQPVTACFDSSNNVPVDLLEDADSTQRMTLKDALDAISPNGNTPTFEAYAFGVTQMQAVEGFEGRKFMVLMTDGVPTFGAGCVGNGTESANNVIPTDPIIELVTNAASAGIKTFVIGAPGSQDGISGADARPWLSAAAQAGQTATVGCSNDGSTEFCHMDMTQSSDFSAALRAGLGTISTQLGSCKYAIPTPPPGEVVDFNQLSVFVLNATGTYFVQSSAQANCTEGWQLADDTIQLCPDTCDRAQADASASVQILAGCAEAVQEGLSPIT